MATPTSATATSALPSRTATNASAEDDAVPGDDTSEVTKLFAERLQAWKHAVGYLEDYITATEKTNHAHGKEYERVLKTVKDPLKEGHHFDQSLGGVAGLFENIRSNTQGISNSHYDTAKQLKGTVLPIFERLHVEIKNKTKELTKGAGKGSKAVDKARNVTQRHIELLGQHTAAFDSTGGKSNALEDPYVVQRGVLHRLNKQILEENNNRQDLISVQNSFAQFEAHIIQTVQQGLGSFMQILNTQAEQTKALYGDMVGNAQRVPLDFEWNGFIQRNNTVLIDPNAPARDLANVTFPNQNHKSTQPLIAGSLERKGKIMRSFDTNYYVVTPSKFFHEYKTDDNLAKDPSPELSLYLPDCVVGGCNGNKFNVKGKDVSKGKFGNSFSISHELQFKAHTPQAANQWWEIIRQAAGEFNTADVPDSSAPSSPLVGKNSPPGPEGQSPVVAGTAATAAPTTATQPAPLQTEGLEKTTLASPTTAGTTGTTTVPTSATAAAPASATTATPATGLWAPGEKTA